MVKLFLSFVLGGMALRCGTDQLCHKYRREKAILLSCRQRWEWAESEVSGKSQWKRRVRTWMLGKSQVYCFATAHLWIPQMDINLFPFATPCYQVACELLLEWLQNRGHYFSCSLFADFLCVSSKWEPLHWSWSRASAAALLTISISFGSVKVNGLTVVGPRVLAFTCSFYSSVLKYNINRDVPYVVSLDAV